MILYKGPEQYVDFIDQYCTAYSLRTYAPVKLFWPNPPGQRKMYVIKKGGALENELIKVIN